MDECWVRHSREVGPSFDRGWQGSGQQLNQNWLLKICKRVTEGRMI